MRVFNVTLCYPKRPLHHVFGDLCCKAAVLHGHSVVQGYGGVIAREVCAAGCCLRTIQNSLGKCMRACADMNNPCLLLTMMVPLQQSRGAAHCISV